MIVTEHIKFVLSEKIELIQLTKRAPWLTVTKKDSYDEGYLDALDFVLNLIESEESEIKYKEVV
jgi:hypothetical protein